MKRKVSVRARARGKGHMTIIELMMNTISPRTSGVARGTRLCLRVLVSSPSPHPVNIGMKWRTGHQQQPATVDRSTGDPPFAVRCQQDFSRCLNISEATEEGVRGIQGLRVQW